MQEVDRLLPAGSQGIERLLRCSSSRRCSTSCATSWTIAPTGWRCRWPRSAALLEEPSRERAVASPHERASSSFGASTPTRTTCSGAHPARHGFASAPGGPARMPSSCTRSAAAVAPSATPGSSRAPSPARRCRCATSSRSAIPTATRSRCATPTRYLPSLGELDLHLVARGPPRGALRAPGRAPGRARRRRRHGVRGLGAVRPRRSLVGDFNSWDGRLHPMRSLGASGVWELSSRRRSGRALQVRDPRASRRAAPEDRPGRLRRRAAAGDRIVDRAAATAGATRSGSRARRAQTPLPRAGLDLRGPPRLVAAQTLDGDELDYASSPSSSPNTSATSASRTSS